MANQAQRTRHQVARDAATLYDSIQDVLDVLIGTEGTDDPNEAATLAGHRLFKLTTIAAAAATENLRRSLDDADVRDLAHARSRGLGYYLDPTDGLTRIDPEAAGGGG